MDIRSFFEALQEHDRGGGLFFVVFLLVCVGLVFWKISVLLTTVAMMFVLLVFAGQYLLGFLGKVIGGFLLLLGAGIAIGIGVLLFCWLYDIALFRSEYQ